MTSLEDRIDVLTRELADHIRLMEAQLAKSSATRTTSASSLSTTSFLQPSKAPFKSTSSPILTTRREEPATATASSPSKTPLASPHPLRDEAVRYPSLPSPSTALVSSFPTVVAPLAATHKEGTLLHLMRSGGFFGAGGSHIFVPHYVVVSSNDGISWYASRADYLQNPQRPLGHAAFWVETYNSRGSRFKKAAVCWPLILEKDCPAATDPSKTYFAVDYYTSSGTHEQVVLGADSTAERNAWVQLLTKYIDLYLAPRAESEELKHITRGAAVPLHRSGVIEGEAPGGTIV